MIFWFQKYGFLSIANKSLANEISKFRKETYNKKKIEQFYKEFIIDINDNIKRGLFKYDYIDSYNYKKNKFFLLRYLAARKLRKCGFKVKTYTTYNRDEASYYWIRKIYISWE